MIASYLGLAKDRVASQTAAFFSKTHLHLKTKALDVKETDISGAGLVEALKKQGIKPEQFLLFLFLDLSKTTGTDIKRPHTDHAGLTAGPGQTVTTTIQAAMRERQLLENNAQSVTWIMFQSLYHAICPEVASNSFDPKQLFYWMIKNEAEEIKTKLINRAYQGIEQAIMSIAWQDKAPWQEYDHALSQHHILSAWNNYELDSTEQDTAIVLNAYADQLFKKISHKKSAMPESVKERIASIIAQTTALIVKLQDPPSLSLNNEVQQEMLTTLTQEQQMQQEQRMETKLNAGSDFVFALETYSPSQDTLANIFQEPSTRYRPIKLPECDDIRQPELLFCQSHFAVTENAETDKLEQLKPIKMVLVKIMPEGKAQYLACTAAGADYYALLLNNHSLGRNDPAYVLMTTEGDILSASNNISFQRGKAFSESDDCQQMLTYAHFLNGRIHNPNVLAQTVHSYKWTKEDYTRMANAVTTVHVSQSTVSLLQNKSLQKLCGWEEKSTLETQKASAAIKKRYKKPTDRADEMTMQRLSPADTITKQSSDVSRPFLKLERALEGYVFGEAVSPIVVSADDEFQLKVILESIHAIKNTDQNPGKELAIAALRKDADRIVNSMLPVTEKLQQLQSIKKTFEDIDHILESLHKQLQKITEPKYGDQKELAIQAMVRIYVNLAKKLPIQMDADMLKDALQNLSDLSKKQTDKTFSQLFSRSSAKTLALPDFRESIEKLQGMFEIKGNDLVS